MEPVMQQMFMAFLSQQGHLIAQQPSGYNHPSPQHQHQQFQGSNNPVQQQHQPPLFNGLPPPIQEQNLPPPFGCVQQAGSNHFVQQVTFEFLV
jgi:hypothetical protein